jgi:hypothetical protein
MAPPRRVRDEWLSLRKPGLADRTLVRGREETYWADSMPSQRRFQVSPDGRCLAFTTPGGSMLSVLRRDGASLELPDIRGGDLRFSPDGSTLAVARGAGSPQRVERVDLRRMEASLWANLDGVRWIEHCGRGLLALHGGNAYGYALTLLPWEGAPQTITATDSWTDRFVAAKSGTRAAFFGGNRDVFVVDVTSPGGEPRRLCELGAPPTNAEMSPDGRTLAVVTSWGLYLVGPDATPRLVDTRSDIHSVWFSRDGASVAWASPARAVYRRGDLEAELLAPQKDLAALRFCQASPGLLVTRGPEVLLWSPEAGKTDVLAQIDATEKEMVIGADVWSGGLVLWMGTPWKHEWPHK